MDKRIDQLECLVQVLRNDYQRLSEEQNNKSFRLKEIAERYNELVRKSEDDHRFRPELKIHDLQCKVNELRRNLAKIEDFLMVLSILGIAIFLYLIISKVLMFF